ncbi:hypothetical protein QJR26_18940 (plasmid) [Clostridium baratii]
MKKNKFILLSSLIPVFMLNLVIFNNNLIINMLLAITLMIISSKLLSEVFILKNNNK